MLKGKSEPKTGISVQDVNGRNKRPSKYKAIEPSRLEDLVKYQPDKYRPLNQDVLNHLTEGDLVKLIFVNREELWVSLQVLDTEEGTLCGNIISKPKKLEGLQVGQLVSFRVEHVVEIHDDSASDDDY